MPESTKTRSLRSIRSYVVREGRMTPGQKRALEKYLPLYGLNPSDGIVNPDDLFANTNNIVIEIGFGMGDSLFETASTHPENGYIGIETHRPGVGHLLQLASDASLSNLKVYMADAVEVLSENIPPSSIDVIQVLFPDPWPKKRHHKRRLVNSTFVNLLATRLKVRGKLVLATDWADYSVAMQEAVADNDMLKACEVHERVLTKYEKRGKSLGHEIIDLAYTRIK